MGARKLFEQQILEAIKDLPDEELGKVASLVEETIKHLKEGLSKKENEEKSFERKDFTAIKELQGKYRGLPSTEEFLARKREEKKFEQESEARRMRERSSFKNQ